MVAQAGINKSFQKVLFKATKHINPTLDLPKKPQKIFACQIPPNVLSPNATEASEG